MRRYRFIESEACGVTGTRHNTQSHRTDSGTEFGHFGRILQIFHKHINHTTGTQTGGKYTGRNNQTNDAAVAMSHTVEELLNQFRRIGARHNHGVNETEEHGGCNAHLHIREPESDNEQKNNRKKRSKGPKNIGMLGQFNIALVHAFVFKTTLLEVAKNETGNRQENNTNDGNQKRTETRIGNEIHHRPFSELGHETVMGRTRRPEGRQG